MAWATASYMHSGYYTLFIRSLNSIFLFNEFSWRDHKLYKDLSMDFCITGHA